MSRKDYSNPWTEQVTAPSSGFIKGVQIPKIQESKTYFTSSGATEWSDDLSTSLLIFFRKLERPFLTIVDIPFQEPLRSSIKRFLVSCEAYYKSSNPVIPLRELLRGAASGPTYTEYLKRLRFKSFITSSDASILEEPDWWKEITPIPINDIGDIFNYQYLPHWVEECNDYEYGFLPLSQEKKYLKRFREMLELLLAETEVDIIDPREILLNSSGSITYNPITSKKSKVFEAKQSKQLNSFSSYRAPCLRTVIQVGPQNARDTVINSVPDLNKIRLIEFQTMKIIESVFSNYTVDRSLDDFEKKYSKFQNKSKWFLCRDLTKEGITKPRSLLKIILEVFHKVYPEMEAFKDVDFFDNFELIKDNETLKPIRGHGLGMANALTTIMQIVIFNMTIRKIRLYDTSHYRFLTLNDDAILGAEKRSELEDFWQLEDEILKGLGLIRNPKKSFICRRGGVFIEKYFSTRLPCINKKESYQRRELYMAYCASNIVHAKQIISSQVYIDKEILQLELEKIALFWGYEFFSEEIHYPAFCGGWYNESIYGVSTDLVRLAELPYDGRVYRAFLACKNSKLKPRFKKGSYSPPISYLFPYHCSQLEESVFGIFDIGTLYEIECKYTSLKVNPELYFRAWEQLRKNRRQIFLEYASCLFIDFIKEITTTFNKDFIPLEFMIERRLQTGLFKGEISDPYQASNPLLSYLSYLSYVGVDANPWSILFSEIDSINSKLTTSQRKRLKVTFGSLSLTGKLTKEYFALPLENEDFISLQERTFSTFSFAKVMAELENPYIPLIKKEYVNPLINNKTKVFGKLMTIKNILIFNEFKNIGTYIAKSGMPDDLIDDFMQSIDEYVARITVTPIPDVESSDDELEYFDPEGSIKYISPEGYKLYQKDPWRAQGEVRKCYINIQRIWNVREMVLSSQLGMDLTRDDFLKEYQNLDDLSKIIWDVVYGDPTELPPEEEEVDFDNDFDMFAE